MRRSLAVVLSMGLGAALLAGCGGTEARGSDLGAHRQASRSGEPGAPSVPVGGQAASVPPPDQPIPSGAKAIAEALIRISAAVRESARRWETTGGPASWPPPPDLVLQGLYQQRIYRLVAGRGAPATAVLARLPEPLRAEASLIVRANADIFAQATPVDRSYRIRTQAPEPAGVLLGYFQEAERRFGVAWQVLAAVAYVETKFGRVVSKSSAGAQGPMQFLPSTWKAYGLGGDIHDPHDAVLGAANYLRASGAPADLRRALYAYNPVARYVDAVMSYAKAMTRDRLMYFEMYTWQVFVLTTAGARRVTGPGR